MNIGKTAEQIRRDYDKGITYIQNLDIPEQVEKNQRFMVGDQWAGVKSTGITIKPVFNIIGRVCDYCAAMIVSNDISASITPFDDSDAEMKLLSKIIAAELEAQIERNKLKERGRDLCRNGCSDGTAFFYSYFDADFETHQTAKGMIKSELIDNVNVIFGNPYSDDIQSQPFIIISQRLFTEQVKDMAKENGIEEDYINLITADNDQLNKNDDSDCLTTVLTKFWKESYYDEQGNKQTTVKFIKSTKHVIIQEETDTRYTLYPLASFTWKKRKNSYQGISPVTPVIDNQIYLNQMFAMAMLYSKANAFPRVLYDSSKISNLVNGAYGALKVNNLDLLGKIMDGIQTPDFSNQVINMIKLTTDYTKECMGASDASLGNVNPENTSAIIAVQQATAVPLEMQKLAYRDCIEEVVRIYIDIMAADFGTRIVKYTDSNSEPCTNQMNFDILKTMNYKLNVDIGDSAYWSEINQVNTLDNLFNKGIIQDPIAYLENVPDKYLKGKQKLIESIKRIQEQQQMTAQQEQINTQQQMAAEQAAKIMNSK